MKLPRIKRLLSPVFALLLLGSCAVFALVIPTRAQQVSREQDIGDLRLGQRIKVDDGTCPAGQVKEISGAKMSSGGVIRASKCIPRLGPKQKK
jgi:preprotein translocase subunit YajC